MRGFVWGKMGAWTIILGRRMGIVALLCKRVERRWLIAVPFWNLEFGASEKARGGVFAESVWKLCGFVDFYWYENETHKNFPRWFLLCESFDKLVIGMSQACSGGKVRPQNCWEHAHANRAWVDVTSLHWFIDLTSCYGPGDMRRSEISNDNGFDDEIK